MSQPIIQSKPQSIPCQLRDMFANQHDNIPLHEPCFHGNEWKYVKECIDSGWVSSVGHYVNEFEHQVARFTGAKHAIAVINGTSGLHASLIACGIGRGDEVLTPTFTFVATANAVHYCNAIPHFIDIEQTSLGVDVNKLNEYLHEHTYLNNGICINKKTARPIKAIIAMHSFGHPVDLDPLLELCKQYKLILIEDAAESLGSYYKDKHTGTLGKCGVLSFNGNKIMTSGAGGMILTNDSHLARSIKHLTTTAKMPHPWNYVHDQVGYNYRLPNINAALGLAQLEQIDGFIQNKRQLAQRYQQVFEQNTQFKILKEPSYARSNYWLNVLILNEASIEQRDNLLNEMHELGLFTRPAWQLMHQLPMYQDSPRMDITTAESLQQRIICLPSSANLVTQ